MKDVQILDKPPEGWVLVNGASMTPPGYDLYSNNKSRFSGERRVVLVKQKWLKEREADDGDY